MYTMRYSFEGRKIYKEEQLIKFFTLLFKGLYWCCCYMENCYRPNACIIKR